MDYSLFFLLDHYPASSQSIDDVYQNVITQSKQAEKLGYYGIYVAEHHVENYGVLPNPALLLAWVGQQTQSLKLGTAITILPLHSPLRVAEEYALLDLLSNGRVELGVGSGFLANEFTCFGQDIENKRQLFDETLLAIEALLANETVSFNNAHLHAGQNAKLNIHTFKHRPLPIYVAAVNPHSAYYIGQQQRHMMAVPFNGYQADVNAPQAFIKNYQHGWQTQNHSTPHGKIIMNFFCHVAESDQQARKNIAKAFGQYVLTRTSSDFSTQNPEAIYDAWLAKDLLLCGSVNTVVNKLRQLKKIGLQHIMTFQNFGAAEPEVIQQSMQLFAKEVITQL
ncbi:MAG: LLM class flavin-dependent oxidoreductase [Gammaproteobacteria bacterium]